MCTNLSNCRATTAYQIVAMIGAGDMGDGRRSVVVKVISSVFPLGYKVPGSNCDGHDRASICAVGGGRGNIPTIREMPSLNHADFSKRLDEQ